MTRTDTKMNDCATSITSAAGSCHFNIPWRFKYKTYLNGLGTKISGYNDRLISIRSAISKADRDFSNLSDHIVNDVNKLETPKVEARKRRIV